MAKKAEFAAREVLEPWREFHPATFEKMVVAVAALLKNREDALDTANMLLFGVNISPVEVDEL